MQAQRLRKCQYCELLWVQNCPFWPVQGLNRKISEPACGQFTPLKDVARFKERKKLDEMVFVMKKQPVKKDKKLKRSLDF
jgi:hypothetical protein